MNESTRGTLAAGEPHPAAYDAKAWIAQQEDLHAWMESFASCAIEGNRLAEICSETLSRLLKSQPVSDRYVLGLAWAMQQGVPTKTKKKKGKK